MLVLASSRHTGEHWPLAWRAACVISSSLKMYLRSSFSAKNGEFQRHELLFELDVLLLLVNYWLIFVFPSKSSPVRPTSQKKSRVQITSSFDWGEIFVHSILHKLQLKVHTQMRGTANGRASI